MTKPNKPTYVTHGSVLDDLGFSPEKAAVLKMKAEMHAALLKKAKKYTQKELQEVLKEPQPRVSEFLNGKIASLSFEKMTVYALRLGAKPAITLESLSGSRTRPLGRDSRKNAPGAIRTKRPAVVG